MDDAVARARAAGVVNAAASHSLPIDGSQWNSDVRRRGRPAPERRELIPSAAMTPVSAGYFETMGTRLVSGRFFTDGDGEQTSRGRRHQRDAGPAHLASARSRSASA